MRQKITMITCFIGRHYSIVMGQRLKICLVKIHFGFTIRFKFLHDVQLLLLCNASLSIKSWATIKCDCHCTITWFFYYWWSSLCTSKRQTYLYLHFLSIIISYSNLSSSFCSFISSLDSCSVPNNVSEALSLLGWTRVMHKKMRTWEYNET